MAVITPTCHPSPEIRRREASIDTRVAKETLPGVRRHERLHLRTPERSKTLAGKLTISIHTELMKPSAAVLTLISFFRILPMNSTYRSSFPVALLKKNFKSSSSLRPHNPPRKTLGVRKLSRIRSSRRSAQSVR